MPYLSNHASPTRYPELLSSLSRWGDQSSKLGPLPAAEIIRQHTGNEGRKKKALEAWGAELKSIEDVRTVFKGFFSGKLALFPW